MMREVRRLYVQGDAIVVEELDDGCTFDEVSFTNFADLLAYLRGFKENKND